MKFDPAEQWDKLSPTQQRAIGMAGLLLHVATEATELLDQEIAGLLPDEPADQAERSRLIGLDRQWEAAEQRAWGLLREVVPQDADLFDEGPAL